MTDFNKAVRRLRSALTGFMRRLMTAKIRVRAIRAARYAAYRPRMPRQVVFVSDLPRSREAKLAYGLRQAGWQVILLHRAAPTFDATRYCAEIHQYRNPFEALLLATRYTPVVYHVFSCWNFHEAAIFIRYKPGKIVFDDYDVLAGMVKEQFAPKFSTKLEKERFCLENADGLCCRSLETQYAKTHLGYKYSGKRIFFPDYCWNAIDSISKLSSDGYLTVANIGNLYININSDVDHQSNYHLKVADLLSQHNIRSYLFISNLTTDLERFLTEVFKFNSYIRFTNMKYEEMLAELNSKCHVGLICAPPFVTMMDDDIYRPVKRKYGMGNKAFDYIDAAIPIIMDPESELLYWLVKRYHKVFDFNMFIFDLDGYRSSIQGLLADHTEELSRARKILSVSHQVLRLIRFYDSI